MGITFTISHLKAGVGNYLLPFCHTKTLLNNSEMKGAILIKDLILIYYPYLCYSCAAFEIWQNFKFWCRHPSQFLVTSF